MLAPWSWLAAVLFCALDVSRIEAQLQRLPPAEQRHLFWPDEELSPLEEGEYAPGEEFPLTLWHDAAPAAAWTEDVHPHAHSMHTPARHAGWTDQWFPVGLVYRSYLGSVREPRFATVWSYENAKGWLWDVSLGGRVGIWRFGDDYAPWPDGWQIDMEGAAFPRLDPFGPSTPLYSTDFRFGIPVTYGRGPLRIKTGYYHLSSHLGDEFMLLFPEVERSNYSRDAFILAASYYFREDYAWRVYAEATWADWADSRGDIAQPWEFLFGVEYSPAFEFQRSTPFFAVNAHLREEANFGGHMSVQAGWQSRRGPGGALFRIGGEYVNGKSTQASFYQEHENRIGVGMWYDY